MGLLSLDFSHQEEQLIKQLTENDWNEIARPIQLCSINMPISDFLDAQGIVGFKYTEDGLGELLAAIIQAKNSMFWIRGSVGVGGHALTLFEVRSFEPDTKVAMESLCVELQLNIEDFDWVNDELGAAKWCLSRYDDNGNEIDMFCFHQEVIAKEVQLIYEKRGHKQAYFVRKKNL